MNNLIDFTDSITRINNYDGADSKQKIIYNGKIYMLKFGGKLEPNEKNPMQASYSSSPVSEYLGSHIFNMVGIPAQQTLLGTYDGRMVVACLDFVCDRPNSENFELVEFKKLETSYLGSSSAGGRTPAYENLMAILDTHGYLDNLRNIATDRYWKMFVVDALIGNFDRHAGNWGYILDKSKNQLVELAPVYDCGSSFYPKLNESSMKDFLLHPQKLEERMKIFPRGALRINGNKVFYHEFLLMPEGKAARDALLELYPQIDVVQIRKLIQDTPGINDIRREFYSTYMDMRYETILKPAYKLAHEERTCSIQTNKEYGLSSECQDCTTASHNSDLNRSIKNIDRER